MLPDVTADAQSRQPGAESSQGPTPVDVAIARTGIVREELEYTGTTARCRKYHCDLKQRGSAESVG